MPNSLTAERGRLAEATGRAEDDLFKVTTLVKGKDVAGTLESTGCSMTWPA